MNKLWDFQLITIEGSDAQGNAFFYPIKKTFDQPNSLGKSMEYKCGSLGGATQ